MQQYAANFSRRLGHEHTRLRLAPHQNRQCSDVILVRVRNNNRVEPALPERFPIRQRFFSLELRVHPGVEDEATVTDL